MTTAEIYARGLAIELYSINSYTATLRLPEGNEVQIDREKMQGLERVAVELNEVGIFAYKADQVRACLR
jgi:hypothetical protein